jgi:hypothetical protein
MRFLKGIHAYKAEEDSLALRNHGDLQLYHKPTDSDTHKNSGYLFSLFFGFSAPNFE